MDKSPCLVHIQQHSVRIDYMQTLLCSHQLRLRPAPRTSKWIDSADGSCLQFALAWVMLRDGPDRKRLRATVARERLFQLNVA